MTSERQIAANRANACHSTGPKTPEGKAAVRLNACRHGLLARDAVLPGEDVDAFEDLFNQLRAHFLPVGPIEEFLVDRLTNTIWRLQRVPRAETGLFHSRMHGVKVDRLAKLVSSYERTYPELPPMYRITDKTAHTEASEALERAGPGRSPPRTGDRRRRQRRGRLRKASALREELGTVAPSGPRQALPDARETPEPYLLRNFRCHYGGPGRYRMTNSWRRSRLAERGRNDILTLVSSRFAPAENRLFCETKPFTPASKFEG